MAADTELQRLTREWFSRASTLEYSYHFEWMGRPVIQFPQDLAAMQELIWKVRPGLIIETGIARGGSLVFYASMLELLGGDGRVLGVDIEIRSHNRAAIEAHPMFQRITMLEGSSIDPAIIRRVHEHAEGRRPVMVVLDSNHTHDHVLAELCAYGDLVTRGSYLVVFDTVIECMPDGFFKDRPWGRDNNPATAVRAFLGANKRFEADAAIDAKLQITVAPGGFLKCVQD
ncbi:MAG: cephalosporin hydroxylase family protein [Planctomycetota bacterium]